MLLPTMCDNIRAPQHFLEERDRAGQQHQRQYPGRSRQPSEGVTRGPVPSGGERRARRFVALGRRRIRHALGEHDRENEHQAVDRRAANQMVCERPSSGSSPKAVDQRAADGARGVHRVQHADAPADLLFFGDRVARQQRQRRAHQGGGQRQRDEGAQRDRRWWSRRDRCRRCGLPAEQALQREIRHATTARAPRRWRWRRCRARAARK